MLNQNIASTKVAVFASSADQRQHLQSMLEKSGINVVVSEAQGDQFLAQLNAHPADVLLIDLGDSEDEDLDFLDSITENSELPILFNDSGPEGVSLGASGDNWAKKLAEKLCAMANSAKQSTTSVEKNDTPFPIANDDAALSVAKTLKPEPKPKPLEKPTPGGKIRKSESTTAALVNELEEPNTAEDADGLINSDLNVWVLGASLGGPQAVRQFLSAIPGDLEVVFILAQHIGANHVSLLAEQLNRVTKFTVVPGKTGHQLRHKQVILTPADKQLSIIKTGIIELSPSPPAAIYSPCIDNVMAEVAKRFGKRAGTIIFSGMGDDGAKGCNAIADNGGIVWAQDVASCVVSSMPDQARKSGKVSHSATPEQLAAHLYEHYCGIKN